MPALDPVRQASGGSLTDQSVIDLDVHTRIQGGFRALLPYLAAPMRDRYGQLQSMPAAIPGHRNQAWNHAPHFAADWASYDPVLGYGGSNRVTSIPPGGGLPGSDARFMVEDHLDRNGIGAAMMLPLQGTGAVYATADPDGAIAIASALNDYHLQEWLPVDDRFRLAIAVAPHDGRAAAAEIGRLAGEPGVVAVMAPLTDRLLGTRALDWILAAAHDAGLAVVAHPGSDNVIGDPPAGGGVANSAFERYTAWGMVGAGNLASLIFEGTFERHPRLKVVLVELGWEWVASFLARADSAWRAGRAAMPKVLKSPTEYVLKHVRFTSQPAIDVTSPAHERMLLDLVHAERTLCYSSDYPHWDGDDVALVFRTASPELRARIFRDNAIEALGERIRPRRPAALGQPTG